MPTTVHGNVEDVLGWCDGAETLCMDTEYYRVHAETGKVLDDREAARYGKQSIKREKARLWGQLREPFSKLSLGKYSNPMTPGEAGKIHPASLPEDIRSTFMLYKEICVAVPKIAHRVRLISMTNDRGETIVWDIGTTTRDSPDRMDMDLKRFQETITSRKVNVVGWGCGQDMRLLPGLRWVDIQYTRSDGSAMGLEEVAGESSQTELTRSDWSSPVLSPEQYGYSAKDSKMIFDINGRKMS